MNKKWLFTTGLLLLLAGCSGQSGSQTTAAGTDTGTTAVETGVEKPQSSKAEENTENKQAKLLTVDERIAATKERAGKLVTTNADGQKVVSSKFGETAVPENPKRIVTIQMEDIALALGIKMVASRNFDGYYLAERLAEAGVEPMEIDEASNTINFEQVLSYNPDLIIIRDNFEQSVVDELSKIAPTIAFNLKDTEATLMGLGMALNKEEDATNRLKQYYEKWDSTREALQSKLGTQKVALVRIMQKEIRLMPYSKNDNSSFLYDPNYLGLVAPQLVKDYDNQESLAISLEKLPELDADQILLIAGYGSADAKMVEAAKTRYKEISSDPLWNTIPAVNAGNIHEVDSRIWLAYGIISNEIKMDDLLKIYGN